MAVLKQLALKCCFGILWLVGASMWMRLETLLPHKFGLSTFWEKNMVYWCYQDTACFRSLLHCILCNAGRCCLFYFRLIYHGNKALFIFFGVISVNLKLATAINRKSSAFQDQQRHIDTLQWHNLNVPFSRYISRHICEWITNENCFLFFVCLTLWSTRNCLSEDDSE